MQILKKGLQGLQELQLRADTLRDLVERAGSSQQACIPKIARNQSFHRQLLGSGAQASRLPALLYPGMLQVSINQEGTSQMRKVQDQGVAYRAGVYQMENYDSTLTWMLKTMPVLPVLSLGEPACNWQQSKRRCKRYPNLTMRACGKTYEIHGSAMTKMKTSSFRIRTEAASETT